METNMTVNNELQPNTSLCGGKYIIEKKIGDGGFGIAYRAVQTVLNRVVCIKEYYLSGYCVRDSQNGTVHPQGIDIGFFEKYRAAFVREAQILAKLHHPGVVEVIDIFDENNTSYMVMPFIEGPSLQSIVEKNGPMSYPEAVNYMAQIASAVGYIHDHHILHRDIKPDNILVTSDYKAVLIDFGSAREFIEDKTQAYTSMVSHGYAPTEQYTRTSRKGSYSDIYSLGATLYFILTGRVPLEAAARLTEELVEPQKLNSTIPPEGNRTILKAMNLKKEDRYQSVRDFMDDLKNVHKVPAEKQMEAKPKLRNNRWLHWLLLALVIVFIVAITTNNIVKHQKEKALVAKNLEAQKIKEEKILKFSNTYEDAVKEFKSNNDNIVVDQEGREGCQCWIEGAIKSLQVIEQCEQDSLFPQLGVTSCFQEKYYLLQGRLIKTKTNIYEKNKIDLDQGISNPYYDAIRERLKYIDFILAQMNGKSVLNVQTSIPD